MGETRYLIIGGGISGTTAADTIRQQDAGGEITIVSGEPHRLYSRIMISKPHYFLGKVPPDQIWLKKEAWYVDKNIKLIVGKKAVRIEAIAKTVTLDDGTVLSYDKLLLAIGICPRRWSAPGADKKGIHYVRTLEDFQGYQPASRTAKQGVVIGGGAIGFEMCELMRLAGLDTTLVIREPHYWDPVLDQTSGRLIEAALERGGVKIIRGQYVTEAYGGDSVEGLVLQDGRRLPCQMVSVGIGGFCPLDWLKDSGLKVSRGVVANEYLEASLPDIWTAGDAAEYFDPIYEEQLQFGSWSNAQNQGKVAGSNMAGRRQPYRLVTFYAVSGLGVSIAFIGNVNPPTPDSGKQIIGRGSFELNAHGRYIIRGGRIIGATLINRTVDVGPLTKLIEQRVDISGKLQELADPKVDLKTLVPV
jgi:NAD(P)H-nitrite reductase large subunit